MYTVGIKSVLAVDCYRNGLKCPSLTMIIRANCKLKVFDITN